MYIVVTFQDKNSNHLLPLVINIKIFKIFAHKLKVLKTRQFLITIAFLPFINEQRDR